MNKKNRTEITPELTARISKVRRKARNYLIKTRIVQFRLDEDSHHKLFRIAELKCKPVGALVRELVIGYVQNELPQNNTSSKLPSNLINPDGFATIDHILALQKQIDELRKQAR